MSKFVCTSVILTGFLFLSGSACAQTNYIGFDSWNPHVNGVQGSVFDAGDSLESKTKIELINNTSVAVTGEIKIYKDGALFKTIGPVNMPPQSVTNITSATTSIANATAVQHVIEAQVKITDSNGSLIGDGISTHIYNPDTGGGGHGGVFE